MILDPKKIRLAIVIGVILLVGLVLFYVATHGRVVVKNPGDKMITLIKLESDNTYAAPVDVSNGSFVSSGEYVIRNVSNETERFTRVTVPRWLGSADITYQNNQTAKTTKVASLTYEHLFPADDGSLVSYSDIGSYVAGYTTHPTDDAFGGNYSDTAFEDELVSPVITSTGQLLGIGHHDEKLERYSFGSKTFSDVAGVNIQMPGRVETEEDVTLFPKIQRSHDVNSGSVGIYEKKKGQLQIIDEVGGVHTIRADIKNSRSIVFDVNDTSWATVETTTELDGNAAAESEEAKLGYGATVHSLTSDQASTISLGRGQVVSEIALSPSGKFLAALIDGELWVYEVSSEKVVMVQPLTITNRIFWNGSKLYALTSDTGISVFDTQTGQLLPVSVGSGGHLSFSNAMPFGSKLYVTAYNAKVDSKLPDGYIIDLTQENDSLTETISRKLPFSSGDYDINFLGNTIYIRINYLPKNPTDPAEMKRVEQIRKIASAKTESLIGAETLKKCKVTFVN